MSAPAAITTSMRGYLEGHPGLKYLFFGGKGGVGKTALAGATALWLAEQGRRTLLASTNPVHSLSGLLGQDVSGGHTAVSGVPDLRAYEIDTRETIERSKKEIREKIQWFLKFADISTKADDFVESATMNPAFEESAMFENMVELMLKSEYDVYVFDTAPTANARRLLGMSKVYSLWVDHDFGIPVGGVVVNMVLDREALGTDVPEFVANRVQMQDDHMATIWEKFDGNVRAIVPLFDQEVRGVPMLRQAAEALFR